MSIKPIYYCFISLLFVCTMAVKGQEAKSDTSAIEMQRQPFIRVGIDPSRYLLTFLQPADRGGLEFAVDMEFWDRFYPTVELGYMFATRNEVDYTLHVDGVYSRLGFDYNLVKLNDAKDRDIFFVGWRMATSHFSQEATDVTYENAFGSITTSFPKQNLTAFWGEITVGVKAEVFRNFFVGWTGRLKYKFRVKEGDLTPYAIPGYGRLQPESDVNGDINIYLSYSFSL